MKRFFSFVITIILLCSCAFAAAADQSQNLYSWAEQMQISPDLLTDLNAALTRGQTAQLLYETAGKPAYTTPHSFSDVPAEYADAVSWAAENEILLGVGDQLFLPQPSLSRQEFATILYRRAGSPTVSGKEVSSFSDSDSIASWAQSAMLWCVKTGLLVGKSQDLIAPKDTITISEALLILQREQYLPDLEQLRTDLNTLTKMHRPIGSEGEAQAAQYLQDRFSDMGYTVSTQTYTNDAGLTGVNVIATKSAPEPDSDILVFSAHHDSVPTAYGANDNASGTVALLAVADALKDLPTDTELRFISFTDEENGKNGSRYYTSLLSEEERSRIIGDLQFDMLGGLGSSGTLLCTTDGEANWLSDLLQTKNTSFSLQTETASDHTSFQLAGIPSVLMMQNGQGYLYHSAADTAQYLDLFTISGAVQTAAITAEEIISQDTGSYQEIAHQQGQGYTYRQTRQNVIYFSSSLADTEAYIGASGQLVDTYEVEGNGWTDRYDTYLYSMRWFDGSQPMNTYYRYRNGFLETIEIKPGETGYTASQVRELICAMYGEPASSEEGKDSWTDPIYSKYITLSQAQSEFTVTVSNYSQGITNVLASYPVEEGQAQISDPAHASVWEFLCSILPQESRSKIAEFNLYTDGCSNVLAYTSPISTENGKDNSRFSISIDYYDVYDENGAPRDWSKLTYTILHEYGHVLLEDETQVDLSVGTSTHDPTGFIPGSFRRRFYDQFWQAIDTGSGVNDYEQNPTRYVSRYGANYFHEDIADTFAVFLLSEKPSGTTVAEEKLLFFWQDEDMLRLRSAIRQNLGLDDPAASGTTPPEESLVAVTSTEEIKSYLEQAISAVQQPPLFDVSALSQEEDLAMAVKNLYFSLTADHPEYKYAYDVSPSLDSNGNLQCNISYMPYRSGQYPADFNGIEVFSLADLIQAAQDNLAQESVAIRITNPNLLVDDMSRALQQVGGSYLFCALNRDGTAITFTPQNGLSKEEALAKLDEISTMADEVISSLIQEDMSQQEKANALYSYLTEQVRYDHRYYADRNNMPYESMTAYGALHDHLAICGGYAQALQVLFEKVNIPCYTISGDMKSENHMWNLAYLDGKWLYFDATSDRGRANYGFYYFGVDSDQLTGYTWDNALAAKLCESVAS